MKKLLPFFAVLLLLIGCKKSAQENTSEVLPSGTVISSGTFVSNSKPTNGTVRIVRTTAGTVHLVIENLNTLNGPDLRIWLSPNNAANPYQEVGLLKAITGNFSYELSAAINYTSNNRVLIWCEDVSVLFGHAVLQ